MFDRYSFVALTAKDLVTARAFWVGLLDCPVTEERADEYFIVSVGGLRLCVDKEDGVVHRLGGTDPTIGLRARSVKETLVVLAQRGLTEKPEVVNGSKGSYAVIHDPDGRSVVLSEFD